MNKDNLELLQAGLLIAFMFSIITIIHEICAYFGLLMWLYIFGGCGVGYMIIEEVKEDLKKSETDEHN